MKMGTIAGIAAIVAVGAGAYFLLKDFKLPDLFGAPLIVAGAAPETIKETGAVGGIGDIIYNIGYGGDLREQATTPGGKYYKAAKAEIITKILPPTAPPPKPATIAHRGVAMGAAETMHIYIGMPLSLAVAPITIGAGLGAIAQQQKYYESLPTKEAKAKAVQLEYTTREAWVRKHPIESMIGFPALIAHAVTAPAPQTDFLSTMARGWGRLFG